MNVLHVLMDNVEGGADVIYMNKKSRRALQAVLENHLHYIDVGRDEFGRKVEMFAGVPIRIVENSGVDMAKYMQ